MNPETGGPKKDSIFSGIGPSQPSGQHSPGQPNASSPAPRPAADAEAVASLRQRMDALERNIVSRMEKVISEQLRSAAPPPPPPAAARQADSDLLSRRIAGLEARLEDFSRAAEFAASQLKNIEESKISARREIGDLLTAVREQQKYSEMDREMHAQLEKSWKRTEELEEKLMGFYSSMLEMEAKRSRDSSAASDTAAAVEALSGRLGALEEKIRELAVAFSSPELIRASGELAGRMAEESRRGAEEHADRLAAENRRAAEEHADRLAAESRRAAEEHADRLAGESRRAAEEHADRLAGETRRAAEANEDARRQMLEDMRDGLSSLKETFTGNINRELETLRREVSASSDGMRRSFEAAAAEQAEFAKSTRTELARAGEQQEERFSDAVRRAEGIAAAMDKFSDTLTAATFMGGFRTSMESVIDGLAAYERRVIDLMKNVSPECLEKASGVSGRMAREHLASLAATAEEFRAAADRLRGVKSAVESQFRDIFSQGQ